MVFSLATFDRDSSSAAPWPPAIPSGRRASIPATSNSQALRSPLCRRSRATTTPAAVVDAAEYVLWRNTLGQIWHRPRRRQQLRPPRERRRLYRVAKQLRRGGSGERRGRRRSRTGYPNLVSCGNGGNARSPTRGCLIISQVLMDYGVAVFESSQADNAMMAMAVPACVM